MYLRKPAPKPQYVFLDRDTLKDAVETAFSQGRSFQADRDSLTIAREIEEFDGDDPSVTFAPENDGVSLGTLEDMTSPDALKETIDEVYILPAMQSGYREALADLRKELRNNPFEEDASTFSGSVEVQRRLDILTPDAETAPDRENHQHADTLARIREILSTPETYAGENKEKVEMILDTILTGEN